MDKKFKVGDIVTLNKIENKFGEDQSSGHGLPKEVRISAIEQLYDYGVETLEGKWLTSVDEKNLSIIEQSIKKQTLFTIKDKELSVVYMSNTKKNNFSILKSGSRSGGRYKLDDINRVMALLRKLKKETKA